MGWYGPAIVEMMQTVVPVSGATIIVPAGTTATVVNNPALLAVLSATLPPNPVDGQRWMIAAASAITLITLSTSDGSTIKGTLTSMALNSYARFLFCTSASAWFRTG